MKIEGSGFTLDIRPGLDPEQLANVARALCRIVIDPPRSKKQLQRVAIRTALMNLCEGSDSGRAKQLADRYRSYLAGAWPREREMEALPEPRSTERLLLHRLARIHEGRSLCWRQFLRLAGAAPESPP
jgi:hypothetical protein